MHWGSRIVVAAIAVSLYSRLQSQFLWPSPLSGLIWLGSLLALIGGFILYWKHTKRLCEQCVKAMPLDPEGAAVKHSNKLVIVHWTDDNRKEYIAAFVVLVLVSLLTNTIGTIAYTVLSLSGIYIMRASDKHKVLQPWCPFCRNGGIEVKEKELTLT